MTIGVVYLVGWGCEQARVVQGKITPDRSELSVSCKERTFNKLIYIMDVAVHNLDGLGGSWCVHPHQAHPRLCADARLGPLSSKRVLVQHTHAKEAQSLNAKPSPRNLDCERTCKTSGKKRNTHCV